MNTSLLADIYTLPLAQESLDYSEQKKNISPDQRFSSYLCSPAKNTPSAEGPLLETLLPPLPGEAIDSEIFSQMSFYQGKLFHEVEEFDPFIDIPQALPHIQNRQEIPLMSQSFPLDLILSSPLETSFSDENTFTQEGIFSTSSLSEPLEEIPEQPVIRSINSSSTESKEAFPLPFSPLQTAQEVPSRSPLEFPVASPMEVPSQFPLESPTKFPTESRAEFLTELPIESSFTKPINPAIGHSAFQDQNIPELSSAKEKSTTAQFSLNDPFLPNSLEKDVVSPSAPLSSLTEDSTTYSSPEKPTLNQANSATTLPPQRVFSPSLFLEKSHSNETTDIEISSFLKEEDLPLLKDNKSAGKILSEEEALSSLSLQTSQKPSKSQEKNSPLLIKDLLRKSFPPMNSFENEEPLPVSVIQEINEEVINTPPKNSASLIKNSSPQEKEKLVYFSPSGNSSFIPLLELSVVKPSFSELPSLKMEEVTDFTVNHLLQGKKNLQFQLFPQHLGKVDVQLEISADKKIMIQFTAENSLSAHQLEENITQLEQSLQSLGYHPQQIIVKENPSLILSDKQAMDFSSNQHHSQHSASSSSPLKKAATEEGTEELPVVFDSYGYGLLSLDYLL